MNIEEEQGKSYNLLSNEFQTKYNKMNDYIMANKDPPKSKDISDVSFIFNDKMVSKTREYMREHAELEVDFDKQFKLFSEIDFHLKNNQNVAIYGYGSKLKLINYYVDFYLSDYPLIVFYGFYGEISFKQILNTIEKMIRKISEDNQDNTKIIKSLKVDDRIEAIKNNLEKIELKKIFIIIHNIDGKKLANEKCQENLSKIASLQKIQLLASFDNIRYLSIFSSKMITNFDFVFLQFDKYSFYEKELGLAGNMIATKQNKNLKSLQYIFKSLAENQKDIIQIIAKYLMENQEELGISHKKLFEECVENMVLGNEIQLKENMIEIIDHKVVQEKKVEGGKIIYTMKYSMNILKKIANKESLDFSD